MNEFRQINKIIFVHFMKVSNQILWWFTTAKEYLTIINIAVEEINILRKKTNNFYGGKEKINRKKGYNNKMNNYENNTNVRRRRFEFFYKVNSSITENNNY